MPFRVTYFFQQRVGLRLAGWSSNFWSALTDGSAVTAAAAVLADAINSFTGRGCALTGARIQDLSAFRAAIPIAYTLDSGTASAAGSSADYPTLKGLLRLSGPGKYQTNQWVGTLQDRDVTTGGVYIPNPDSVTRFNAIRAILTATPNGWSLNSQNKGIASVNVIAVTAPGVVTAPAHGLLTGDKTRISRTAGVAGLNRIWLVTKIDNDTFQVVAPPAGGFVGSLTAPGKSTKQARILQAISDAVIVRATKHDVGRPFGLFSGRRKRRRT